MSLLVFILTFLISIFNYKNLADSGREANIKAKNITNRSIIYKIKTTAPRKYIIKGPIGIIKADETHDLSSKFIHIKDIYNSILHSYNKSL